MSKFKFKRSLLFAAILSFVSLFYYTLLYANATDHSMMASLRPSVPFAAVDDGEVYYRIDNHFNWSSAPLILIWSIYANFKLEIIQERTSCDCFVTKNRSLLKEANAVLFSVNDIKFNDMPKRYPHQYWVLLSYETPHHEHHPTFKKIVKEIDLIVSYRRDADVFAPYGFFVKRKRNISVNLEFLNEEKAGAVWFVSHCKTPSHREEYARELKRHIHVDIYGYCGDLKCALSNRTTYSSSKGCYEMIEKKYTFYLSFENSLCKDYITEKIFNVMQYNIIPVVFGGADYKSFLPPNSYIDALSFESPEELSKYLKLVQQNRTLQSTFFAWKNHYEVKVGQEQNFCRLCKRISYSSVRPISRSKIDRYKWWFQDANCRVWNVPFSWKWLLSWLPFI